MANRSFYHPKPPRRREQDDDSVYDEPGVGANPEQGDIHGQEASTAADKTLGNIDDVLNDSATPEELNEAEEDAAPSFFNPGGDSGDDESDDSGGAAAGKDLQSAENEGGKDGGLFNPHGDKPSRLGNLKGSVKGLLKNKWLLGGAVGGGVVVLLTLALLILAASLKLPNVMQHIESYEFARISRQFAVRSNTVTDETLAMDAADDTTYSKIKQRFADTKSQVRESTWGKMDKYRPQKVVDNLGTAESGGLKIKLKQGLSGRKQLVSVSLYGQEYKVKPVTGVSRFIPGVKDIVETRNQTEFIRDFTPAMQTALQDTNSGTIVRGLAARALRQRLGINLIAWNLAKFPANNDDAALREETRQTYQKTSTAKNIPDNALTDSIAEGEVEAAAAEEEAVSKDSTLQEAIDNGGISPAEDAAIAKNVGTSLTDNVLGVVNPVYAIATPICIIYDGSVNNSGPTIDNQTNQQQALFVHLASAADQQKRGDLNPTDAAQMNAAIKATNMQIGDITKSVPEIRASGSTVSTNNIVSAQAGADGSFVYSLVDALGVTGTTAKIANTVAEKSCPVLTNLTVAGTLAAANIVAAIFSFGGTEAGEEAAGQSARVFITAFVKDAVSRLFEKQVADEGVSQVEKSVLRSALSRGWKFAFPQGIIAGVTVGTTELAHLVVASRAGSVNSGLAQGADIVNAADAGANSQGGTLEQQQLFGGPMMSKDVAQSDDADTASIAYANSQKSFTDRYFAVSNADSLVSHMAMSVSGVFSNGVLNSLFRVASSVLQPMRLTGSLLVTNGVARAASSPSTLHYGNVQFGWTNDEEGLIASDSSYKPLENREILDQSGQEINIAKKYAVCFGYEYQDDGNGDLSPTDPDGNLKYNPEGSIGNLLSSRKIARDADGNVINDSGSLCSPKNLSFNNDEFGSQMVFRWRLAMSYDTTLDQLNDMQNVQ